MISPLLLTIVFLTLCGKGHAFEMDRRDFIGGFTFFLSLDPFRYSDEWAGTNLKIQTLDEAAKQTTWNMARWPDPILRRPATPVTEFGTKNLRQVMLRLKETANREGAVGLAAAQSGVDARIIYLQGKPFQAELFLINPRIVRRSNEVKQKSWNEFCLVLPPNFRATVLRDQEIMVEYQDWSGSWKLLTLRGERARAFQHEFDHDRGILITDHVSLELLDPIMRNVEREGHDERMDLAFSREIAPMHDED